MVKHPIPLDDLAEIHPGVPVIAAATRASEMHSKATLEVHHGLDQGVPLPLAQEEDLPTLERLGEGLEPLALGRRSHALPNRAGEVGLGAGKRAQRSSPGGEHLRILIVSRDQQLQIIGDPVVPKSRGSQDKELVIISANDETPNTTRTLIGPNEVEGRIRVGRHGELGGDLVERHASS